MKYYMIKYKKTNAQAKCFPYLFESKENAQRYIDEATYYPKDFEVIEAIKI